MDTIGSPPCERLGLPKVYSCSRYCGCRLVVDRKAFSAAYSRDRPPCRSPPGSAQSPRKGWRMRRTNGMRSVGTASPLDVRLAVSVREAVAWMSGAVPDTVLAAGRLSARPSRSEGPSARMTTDTPIFGGSLARSLTFAEMCIASPFPRFLAVFLGCHHHTTYGQHDYKGVWRLHGAAVPGYV